MPLRLSETVVKRLNWLLLIAWMGGIFYFSHQSDLSVPGADVYLIRKAGHVSEFLVLFVLWIRTLRATVAWNARRVVRLALLLTSAYAISDEIHQTFIAGRSGNVVDVLIDTFMPSVVWLFNEKATFSGA
jgi:VanZ family protein